MAWRPCCSFFFLLQKKRLKPVSHPCFDEFLSLRGPGGVVGGFGGQAPPGAGAGQGGGTLGARLEPTATDTLSQKTVTTFNDTSKVGGAERPSSRVEVRRLAARVGTPAVDRARAAGGAALEEGAGHPLLSPLLPIPSPLLPLLSPLLPLLSRADARRHITLVWRSPLQIWQ